jgi:sodium-independent sulfate anion transporter 11
MATTTSQRIADKLGFREDEREHDLPDVANAEIYIGEEPTVGEFLREHAPGPRAVKQYVYNLFPFVHWIGKYNWVWFLGDFIAGMCILYKKL